MVEDEKGWRYVKCRLKEGSSIAATRKYAQVLKKRVKCFVATSKLKENIDRNDLLWDDPPRRPSHTDRRNFLRR